MPFLQDLPTKRTRIIQDLNFSMGKVAKNLIERCHKELEFGDFGAASIKSVIGALREYMTPNVVVNSTYYQLMTYLTVKAGSSKTHRLSEGEVLSQVRGLNRES